MKKKNLIICLVSLILLFTSYFVFTIKNDEMVYYEVSFSFTPIESGDYSKLEKTIRTLIKYRDNQDNLKIKKELDTLIKNFNITDKITFFKITDHNFGEIDYNFSEHIKNKKKLNYGVKYYFDNVNKINGIPIINVKADISFKPYSSYKASEDIQKEKFLQEAKYWPVNNSYIKGVVDDIIKDDMTVEEKIISFSKWINNNMKPAKEKGTRYGALTAIKTKKGRCMDYSDIFITFCRIAGIPTRQVYGRIYNGGGHAWAEVYIEGKGWYPVEPQFERLGVSKKHIPLFVSPQGNFPALYWTIPKIDKKEGILKFF